MTKLQLEQNQRVARLVSLEKWLRQGNQPCEILGIANGLELTIILLGGITAAFKILGTTYATLSSHRRLSLSKEHGSAFNLSAVLSLKIHGLYGIPLESLTRDFSVELSDEQRLSILNKWLLKKESIVSLFDIEDGVDVLRILISRLSPTTFNKKNSIQKTPQDYIWFRLKVSYNPDLVKQISNQYKIPYESFHIGNKDQPKDYYFHCDKKIKIFESWVKDSDCIFDKIHVVTGFNLAEKKLGPWAFYKEPLRFGKRKIAKWSLEGGISDDIPAQTALSLASSIPKEFLAHPESYTMKALEDWLRGLPYFCDFFMIRNIFDFISNYNLPFLILEHETRLFAKSGLLLTYSMVNNWRMFDKCPEAYAKVIHSYYKIPMGLLTI